MVGVVHVLNAIPGLTLEKNLQKAVSNKVRCTRMCVTGRRETRRILDDKSKTAESLVMSLTGTGNLIINTKEWKNNFLLKNLDKLSLVNSR